MADKIEAYGQEYEDELYAKLAPKVEAEVKRLFPHTRGARFGAMTSIMSKRLGALRTEIALDSAKKRFEQQEQIRREGVAEEQRVKENQRRVSEEMRKESAAQSKASQDKNQDWFKEQEYKSWYRDQQARQTRMGLESATGHYSDETISEAYGTRDPKKIAQIKAFLQSKSQSPQDLAKAESEKKYKDVEDARRARLDAEPDFTRSVSRDSTFTPAADPANPAFTRRGFKSEYGPAGSESVRKSMYDETDKYRDETNPDMKKRKRGFYDEWTDGLGTEPFSFPKYISNSAGMGGRNSGNSPSAPQSAPARSSGYVDATEHLSQQSVDEKERNEENASREPAKYQNWGWIKSQIRDLEHPYEGIENSIRNFFGGGSDISMSDNEFNSKYSLEAREKADREQRQRDLDNPQGKPSEVSPNANWTPNSGLAFPGMNATADANGAPALMPPEDKRKFPSRGFRTWADTYKAAI